jgi:hypothetical protein
MGRRQMTGLVMLVKVGNNKVIYDAGVKSKEQAKENA